MRNVRGTVAGVLVTFFLVLVSVPVERSRVDRIVGLTIVVYAAFAARRRLGVGSRPGPHEAPGDSYDTSPADEQDVRLARLDASVRRAAESGDQYARVTRPAMRQLAAERLRTRHGIDVNADPARARQRMGEDLWEMFATPPDHVGPAPGPERLRSLVAALESL